MPNLKHVIKNCDQMQVDIIAPTASGKQAIIDLIEIPLLDAGFNIKRQFSMVCGIPKETLIITKKL